MVATAVPKMPPETAASVREVHRFAEVVRREQRERNHDCRQTGGFHAEQKARRSCWWPTPRRDCFGDLTYRSVGTGGVVLRDEEEGDRGNETDDAANRELPLAVWEDPVADDEEANRRQRRDNVKALVELAHRILGDDALRADREEADHRADHADRANQKREEDPGNAFRSPVDRTSL